MMGAFNIKCLILFAMVEAIACGDGLNIVRGVAIKHQGFYDEDKDFTCFDGSKTIPYTSVNDDYCDCVDGSDEPGTSACPEGRYYCENLGYKEIYIQSSRVNDGICDCCDGSDEYDSSVACFNQCQKFGAEEMEKRKRELEEANAGFRTKQELIQKGQDTKTQKKKRYEEINQLLEERRTKLQELKAIKEAAETPEKEAKDCHQKNWEELQAKQKEERENIERGEAFALLDTDKDGWITLAEMMSNNHLDADITEADVKDLLAGEAMVDSEKFVDVWSNIKPKFLKSGRPVQNEDEKTTEENTERSETSEVPPEMPPGNLEELTKHSSAVKEEQPSTLDGEDNVDDHGNDVHDDEDDDNEDDEEDHTRDYQPPEPVPEEGEMPEYDEETKKLIQAADDARKNFDEEDKKVRHLESEHSQLQSYLDIDFGQEEEFSSLKGECFEYTDREYTYKLCPFEKVTQRSKNGGAETDLGRWGKWEVKYNSMKYENGQSCWNGPSRSTMVRLSCGKESMLITVSEPSRCEYEMEFKAPALCIKVEEHPKHDEF